MAIILGQFFVAALVIIIAGTYLSRFADEIAERTDFGRLLIGSVLLAGATSLPELSVDLSAVRTGMSDLAMGDLMGSSLFNLLILAVLDLSTHSSGAMLSRKAARHALSGNVSAILILIVAMSLLAKTVLGSGEFLGVSYGLWLVLLGYILGVRLISCDQTACQAEEQAKASSTGESKGWLGPAFGFSIAAAAIVMTGPYLAQSAGQLADMTGLGKTFMGTTLVAFSTSLPELVASIAAIRMGAHDLAIGNVFGSNAFNMLLLIPLDMAHSGPLLSGVSAGHALTCIASVIATLIVVLGQLYQVERRWRLIEPDATLVIVVVFGALWLIYQMGG